MGKITSWADAVDRQNASPSAREAFTAADTEASVEAPEWEMDNDEIAEANAEADLLDELIEELETKLADIDRYRELCNLSRAEKEDQPTEQQMLIREIEKLTPRVEVLEDEDGCKVCDYDISDFEELAIRTLLDYISSKEELDIVSILIGLLQVQGNKPDIDGPIKSPNLESLIEHVRNLASLDG